MRTTEVEIDYVAMIPSSQWWLELARIIAEMRSGRASGRIELGAINLKNGHVADYELPFCRRRIGA